ncbi:MAG: M10 family metallopeptidase C-terminal domain-containing protein [Hyphomicrobiaceae bacterium]|nr:M10 family metallopeptidase C-terminal domain-containing protein [Hyphomicrobiaceae bacterium]
MTTVNELDGTDAANSTATVYDIAVGDEFIGDTDFNYDDDWVSVSLLAGVNYDIYFDIVTGNGTYADIVLRDDVGSVVPATGSRPNWKGHDLAILYTPGENNVFYVHMDNSYVENFTYKITVVERDVPPPAPPTNWTDAQFIDQLVNGYWEDYRSAAARKFDTSVDNVITVNISGLTSEGQEMARAVMALWAGVSGLEFQESGSSTADILMDDEAAGADTEFDLNTVNDAFIDQARINIDKNLLTGSNYVETYTFQTFLHEFGHALGLGHLGNYNSTATYATDGTGNNQALNDSWQKSVMSYFNQNENTELDATLGYAITPMLIDILAIQQIYSGLGVSYKPDNTIYDLSGLNTPRKDFSVPSTAAQPYAMTLFDTGGNDTFDASAATDRQFAKLVPGAVWNVDGGTGNIVVGPNTIIENFKGGSNVDVVTGNDRDNVILGNGGNDILSGRRGDDTLRGGGDNDILKGDQNNDTLRGDNGVDRLDGGADNDRLWGGKQNDILIPGTGNDRMWGEGGSDIFRIGRNDDVNLIYDFHDGRDRLDLSGFHYASKNQAMSHFSEMGKRNDDKVKFVDQGTVIKIKGIDLHDVSNGDFLI